MRDTYARNDNLSRRPAFSSPARFSAVGADLPEHRPRALAASRPVLASMKKLAEPAEMVWSRASLVVGVQQHGGLARRLWHSPLAAVSAAAVAKAAPLHCCRLPRHRLTTPRLLRRNCRALCYTVALPRRSAVLRLPLPLLPTVALLLRAAQLRLRYCRSLSRRFVYCRDAAPRRACCRTASLRCGRVAQLLLSYSPPTALLLPRRSSTLPRCSAPRRSASLCYMLPALHRAASLLPRCFAAAAPLRYCHSTARPPLGCA